MRIHFKALFIKITILLMKLFLEWCLTSLIPQSTYNRVTVTYLKQKQTSQLIGFHHIVMTITTLLASMKLHKHQLTCKLLQQQLKFKLPNLLWQQNKTYWSVQDIFEMSQDSLINIKEYKDFSLLNQVRETFFIRDSFVQITQTMSLNLI